ncbi:uncharacterized protein BX664DRAFT_290901, partial [Halteromyces radiatus]|uniref:uncharacterized protein n=1 Tax=Halteromyces radiatus TaxID=101107 RepID=UPI00221FEB1E
MNMTKKLSALVDTGSTLIYLPPTVIRQLFGRVEGFRRANGLYITPCDSKQLQSITFHIGNNKHVLTPNDYLIRRGKLASIIGN